MTNPDVELVSAANMMLYLGKIMYKVIYNEFIYASKSVGHACGHNLIAVSGVACALAIKKLLELDLVSGSVYLFGTPAEETTSGKTNFVKTGTVQQLVDFAMMLHPGPDNGVYAKALALDSFVVEFFGVQSHAGAAPWNGVNAIDALMQSFNNVALFQQQTLSANR
jgi:metal-dependent amidase/aminoacylase/carboxypeptidase family protein